MIRYSREVRYIGVIYMSPVVVNYKSLQTLRPKKKCLIPVTRSVFIRNFCDQGQGPE